MTDETEGGDAAAAGAKSPRSGKRKAARRKSGRTPHAAESSAGCPNCGTALIGTYCHACGQSTHIHRTLGAIWHDLVHGVLHLDGKISRTLPLLAWRPGELTRRYIDGERAKFVSPMALFLFSVFLMFVTFSTIGAPYAVDDEAVRTEAARDIREEMARNGGEPADVRRWDNFSEFSRDVEPDTGWPSLNKALSKAGENPSLFAYKIQNNAYKFSWALIIISVPFVWLLFLHRLRYRAYRAYDHAVFVTYSIAFMSLALVVLSLLRALGVSASILDLAILIPPIHIYRQLRGAYQLSRPSAAWRTFALAILALLAVAVFFTLLAALGLIA